MIPIFAMAIAVSVATLRVRTESTGDTNSSPPDSTSRLYSFTMKTIDGKEKSLSDYQGKVLMIVNVASKCGYTPQYAGLEALFKKYKARGFVILGFPSNDFLGQEPGTDDEIKQFCTLKYDVTFEMFSKISVKGEDQHPLYKYLTTDTRVAGSVRWNFQKYLVDREGNVVDRFSPGTEPQDPAVIEKLETLLTKSDQND